MEVHGLLQSVAPVVRHAFHAETLRQVRDLHTARNAPHVIDEEPHDVNRPPADILGIVVNGKEELADVKRHIHGARQFRQAVNIGGGQGVFEGNEMQLVEQTPDRQGLAPSV